jgi:hypothetical protein
LEKVFVHGGLLSGKFPAIQWAWLRIGIGQIASNANPRSIKAAYFIRCVSKPKKPRLIQQWAGGGISFRNFPRTRSPLADLAALQRKIEV